MNNLAHLTVTLLSTITFQPAEGMDPDEVAAIEQEAWQTLIHHLAPAEREAIEKCVHAQIAELQSQGSLPEHLETKLSVLQQFLAGELE